MEVIKEEKHNGVCAVFCQRLLLLLTAVFFQHRQYVVKYATSPAETVAHLTIREPVILLFLPVTV